MWEAKMLLKIVWMLSTMIIIIAQMDFRQKYKLKYGRCISNKKALRLFGLNVIQCIEECQERASCGSITYNRMQKLCEVNGKNTTAADEDCPGIIFSRRSEWLHDATECSPACGEGQKCEKGICTVKECRPHIDVENAKVYGNRREVGSKLKYVCTTSSVTAIVKCGKNGSWTTRPVCRAKSIGKTCSSPGDCWELNSLCIEGLCFCMQTAKYDAQTGECIKECENYTDGFVQYKNRAVTNYNIKLHQDISLADCKSACVELGNQCGSIDYTNTTKTCYLGEVNYQQLQDAHPNAIRQDPIYEIYSRDCKLPSS